MNFMQHANEGEKNEVSAKVEKWFEELDRFNSIPFPFNREQPIVPERKILTSRMKIRFSRNIDSGRAECCWLGRKV